MYDILKLIDIIIIGIDEWFLYLQYFDYIKNI